jgi:hypothetical protein
VGQDLRHKLRGAHATLEDLLDCRVVRLALEGREVASVSVRSWCTARRAARRGTNVLDRLGHERVPVVLVADLARPGPVEDAPELLEAVLDGRAGQAKADGVLCRARDR